MWNTEGDSNSKTYHALTKKRRARNRMFGLPDGGEQQIADGKGRSRLF